MGNDFLKEDYVKQYDILELQFRVPEPEGTYVHLDFSVQVTCNEKTRLIKGFYAGGGHYKARLYLDNKGTYTWQVVSSFVLEGNLSGNFECYANDGSEHGRVLAVDSHFEYENGELYHPFGTTIYALVHQDSTLIEETFETLRKSCFNKVRYCVFPKSYDYNYEETTGYAFEKDSSGNWDVHRPNFEFWDKFEDIIVRLSSLGIESDVILFHPYDRWGFSSLSQEDGLVYLDYLVRRFSAFPHIWWSLGNEYDLIYHKPIEEWYAYEEFIAQSDPYGHLLSNHQAFIPYDFSRENVSHQSVQTTQLEHADEWLSKFKKPLIYDEVGYEGDLSASWGNLTGFELVHRFWQACVQGAYVSHGETFLSNDDIIWWSKGGGLKGESEPRIAFLKGIIEGLPGSLTSWKVSLKELFPEKYEAYEKMQHQGIVHSVERLKQRMDGTAREALHIKEKLFRGHYEDAVFINYFGRHAVGECYFLLPEEGSYKLEIIDIWEMTRECVQKGVNGYIHPLLPGKEGIAVLATKISEAD